MHHGALRGIGQKRRRHLVAPRAFGVASLRPPRGAFGLIGALQLVVAGRVLEQLVDGGRRVVGRRFLDAPDALALIDLESWAQSEPRLATGTHGDQVEAVRRHRHLQPLHRVTVAALEQRRLPAGLRQVVDRGHRQRAVALRRRARAATRRVQDDG